MSPGPAPAPGPAAVLSVEQALLHAAKLLTDNSAPSPHQTQLAKAYAAYASAMNQRELLIQGAASLSLMREHRAVQIESLGLQRKMARLAQADEIFALLEELSTWTPSATFTSPGDGRRCEAFIERAKELLSD